MIVKVQLSLFSPDDDKYVLIYNKERDFHLESNEKIVIEPIIEIMKGRNKAYFNAELDENDSLQIKDEVFKLQNW